MTETVADILAGRKARAPRTDLQRGLRRLRKLDRLLDRLVAAARPEDDPVGHDDWSLIYHVVFSSDPGDIGPRADAALELAGTRFPSYCDPDTSYEADVRAWVEAFKEALGRVEERSSQED